ncbi:MAG TPA: class I SAM-dependent methyltransferase, partial [Xanthobacteraceae bacterium]|nr:class I SAM-dependent methyltransferase [Xanthobacteraceae bacterium]
SGHPDIDRYLAERYDQVRGMSSRFAAAICGHAIRRQTELGVTGDIVEIGTFEGRFFIAMALGLGPEEVALGIDLFDWPNAGVLDRLLANCEAAGLPPERFVTWKQQSRTIVPDELRAKLASGHVRFFHIDGEHEYESLSSDLELAHAVLHPSGIICIDDMLHPGYPTLITAVLDYLSRHRDMRVMCIIDREDIVAATKFLICRDHAAALYEQDLMQSFARFHHIVGADVMGHFTLVLTPQPRDGDVGWDT